MAPGMTRGDVVRTLVAALAGRLDAVERFEVIRASAFAIHASRRRLLVSLDGELAVLDTPLRYRARPGVLSIRVPAPAEPELS
jgi:diacylglycerol kinase family enzyme